MEIVRNDLEGVRRRMEAVRDDLGTVRGRMDGVREDLATARGDYWHVTLTLSPFEAEREEMRWDLESVRRVLKRRRGRKGAGWFRLRSVSLRLHS
jgi:archaellum component FlaC